MISIRELLAQKHKGPQLNSSTTHYVRNGFCDDNFRVLIDIISTEKTFTSIETKSCLNGDKYLPGILQAIETNGNIENLDMSGMIFNQEMLIFFPGFIQNNTSLKTLKLDASLLCIIESYSYFSTMLENNGAIPCQPETLKELEQQRQVQEKTGQSDLYFYKKTNIIRSTELINALANSSLDSLTFRLWNRTMDIGHSFNKQSLQALEQLLNTNKTIKHLGFESIEIDSLENWAPVFASLCSNSSITSLSFVNCKLSKEIATALLAVLKNNSQIQSVHFERQEISSTIFDEIAQLLEERKQPDVAATI